jgi:hypothetical protein
MALEHRTRLGPLEYMRILGSAESRAFKYDEETNTYVKTLRLIKGLHKAREKAPKFTLMFRAGIFEFYVTKNGGASFALKDAIIFAHGFDNPEFKVQYWSKKLGLKVYTSNIYLPPTNG